MKNIAIFLMVFVFISINAISQTQYYDSANGKTGEELKSALHEIIKGHKEFTYTQLWNLMHVSDEDPNNPENVILIYTGRSQDKDHRDRGSDYDYESKGYEHQNAWNREHVWSKSHGDFGTSLGAGTDLHHIRPADHSVNNDRYTKDFDNGGEAHDEATGCKFDSDSWEPRDEVKGDIARMMFYMAVRYEGNSEPDLELVDRITDYPHPEFGVLSTLLEWNRQDPPDAQEMRRNHIIYGYQGNRNPFIDNPAYADMIWSKSAVPVVEFSEIQQSPEKPDDKTEVAISAKVNENANLTSAKLVWGTDYYNISNEVGMRIENNNLSARIPVQEQGAKVYYQIIVSSDEREFNSALFSFSIPIDFEGELLTIKQIQGEAKQSPYEDEIVSTKGIVTGVFGNDFYLQDQTGAWNGIYVYNSENIPDIGDKLILTAAVKEYHSLTELVEISYYQVISKNNPLPEPVTISSSVLTANSDQSEQYEGVYVRVENVDCTEGVKAYGLWKVNDGSGETFIHNPVGLNLDPVVGEMYTIEGIATYTYGDYKIDIRNADDVQMAADTKAPEIASYELIDQNNLTIYFNEDVDKESAENLANYTINKDVKVTAAKQHLVQKKRINLTVEGLSVGDYTLIINGVKDLSGNATDKLNLGFSSEFTNIESNEDIELNIYPNPFTDAINIFVRVSNTMDSRIEIFNVQGMKIYEFNNLFPDFGQNVFSLDLSELKTGMYFVKFINNNKNKVYKLYKK